METILSNPKTKYWIAGLFLFMNAMALYKFEFDSIVDYYWHLCISTGGGVIWGWLWFVIEKNVSDTSKANFNYGNYTNEHWEEWILTFMLSFPIVGYLPEVIIALSPYIEHKEGINNLYYFIPGPLSLMLIYAAVWVKNKFKP